MSKQVFIIEMFDFTEEEAMYFLTKKFMRLPKKEQLIKTSLLGEEGVRKINKHIFGKTRRKKNEI